MFKIATDSTCDLNAEFIENLKLKIFSLSCIMDGEVYGRDKVITPQELYAALRNGKLPTTSQVNIDEAVTYFEEIIKDEPETKEILYVAFSSGLSGTYNSVAVAANDFMEQHPDIKIRVVDTVAATLGEGLLVRLVARLRDLNWKVDEAADWLENKKLNQVTVFTVDDLNHLYRGGRVSKATAFVGTLAGIKPVLHVNDEGKLISVGKARGRKKSLQALVDYMEDHLGDAVIDDTYLVHIAHGDCAEDAELVKNLIAERFGVKEFYIDYIGPVIGSHAGPGTIALSFMGGKR